MKTYKILLFTNNVNSPTFFYRMLPFKHVTPSWERKLEVNIAPQDITWVNIHDHDVILMENPYTPYHKEIARLAKELNKKLWVDWSISPFSLTNQFDPLYHLYSNSENCQAISDCLKLASIVTVAREQIRIDALFFNKNIHVIPNTLMGNLYSPYPPVSQNKTVFYRSMRFYRNTLINEAERIVTLATDFPDWEFIFMVLNPDDLWLLDGVRNITVKEPRDIINYNKYLIKLNPGVIINDSQLEKDVTDLYDTNYAHIDAKMSGATCFTFEQLESYLRHSSAIQETYVPPMYEVNAIRQDLIEKCLTS